MHHKDEELILIYTEYISKDTHWVGTVELNQYCYQKEHWHTLRYRHKKLCVVREKCPSEPTKQPSKMPNDTTI